MLKDEIANKKLLNFFLKKDLIQLRLTCQTLEPGYDIKITLLKKKKGKDEF
jgi:hypothetical protein